MFTAVAVLYPQLLCYRKVKRWNIVSNVYDIDDYYDQIVRSSLYSKYCLYRLFPDKQRRK